PSSDEQVGAAVVVEVADGDAVPEPAAERGDPRWDAHVDERAVPRVAEEPVSVRRALAGGGRELAALDGVDVEEAVAGEVDQAEAAAHRLGEAAEGRLVVIVDEPEAGRLGVVAELGGGGLRRRGGGPGTLRGAGVEEVGQGDAARGAGGWLGA